MSKARELINAHLFPVLAVVSTGAMVVIAVLLDAGLSNNAQLSQHAANHNSCVYTILNIPNNKKPQPIKITGIAGAVRYCNGGN